MEFKHSLTIQSCNNKSPAVYEEILSSGKTATETPFLCAFLIKSMVVAVLKLTSATLTSFVKAAHLT